MHSCTYVFVVQRTQATYSGCCSVAGSWVTYLALWCPSPGSSNRKVPLAVGGWASVVGAVQRCREGGGERALIGRRGGMDERSRLDKKSFYVNAVSGTCLQSAARL